jgi:excisionase family DNA binding protein
MYLSVQLAARRLGVSPHTIRRWTDSGVLPCIRTAGGHRRMRRDDVDELANLIAAGDHVAARVAREREVETLVEASIALSSRLEPGDLLGEIARRVTGILDCHFCAISDYDPETDVVCVLADFDRNGQRFAEWKPYSLHDYPFTRRLLEARELGVVTVGDPAADPAETAVMRRWGEQTMLLVPLVHGGQCVGLLEVYDHVRERRFTRQELRLARALAGLAAVALHNARVFARLARSDAEARVLAASVDAVSDGLSALSAAATLEDALRETATLACRVTGGCRAFAAWDGVSACAGDGAGEDEIVAAQATPAGTLTVTVSLPHPASAHAERTLRLVTAGATQVISSLRRPDADAAAGLTA